MLRRFANAFVLVLVLSSCSHPGAKTTAKTPSGVRRNPYPPLLQTHTFLTEIDIDIHKDSGELVSTNSFKVTFGEVFLTPRSLPDGKYQAMVSRPGSLTSRVDFEVVRGEVTKPKNLALRFGDLDDNDLITPEELAFVTKKVGTDLSRRDSFFGDTDDKFRQGYADFDGNRKIDAADQVLVKSYVGQTSDRLINN